MPKVAKWLYPFRWQVTALSIVIFLAPNALEIIRNVAKLWIAN
jgi:hypothetical protein